MGRPERFWQSKPTSGRCQEERDVSWQNGSLHCRESQGWTTVCSVVCPNVTGRTNEGIGQSKSARAGQHPGSAGTFNSKSMFSKLSNFPNFPKIWKCTKSDLEVLVHFQILERRNLESLESLEKNFPNFPKHLRSL